MFYVIEEIYGLKARNVQSAERCYNKRIEEDYHYGNEYTGCVSVFTEKFEHLLLRLNNRLQYDRHILREVSHQFLRYFQKGALRDSSHRHGVAPA